jgi:hypothetical protein
METMFKHGLFTMRVYMPYYGVCRSVCCPRRQHSPPISHKTTTLRCLCTEGRGGDASCPGPIAGQTREREFSCAFVIGSVAFLPNHPHFSFISCRMQNYLYLNLLPCTPVFSVQDLDALAEFAALRSLGRPLPPSSREGRSSSVERIAATVAEALMRLGRPRSLRMLCMHDLPPPPPHPILHLQLSSSSWWCRSSSGGSLHRHQETQTQVESRRGVGVASALDDVSTVALYLAQANRSPQAYLAHPACLLLRCRPPPTRPRHPTNPTEAQRR